MKFEKVHTIRDFYDGIRTGTADLSGAPHYFASVFDDDPDDYTQHFRLYAVTSQFMERELRQWTIYRAWEARFHRGLEPRATHPGHGGIVPEYDELGPVDKRDSQISVSMIQDCLSRGGRIGARRSEQCGMGDNFTFATA
jgi:hypothetical protein